jgi:predicted O-methyltransferase YrrM
VEIVDPRIEDYVERFSSPADPLLAELADETRRTLRSPVMLSGPIAARLLEMLVWIGQPRRVLEIGTYSGHSALAMAAALPAGGLIDTCEVDPVHAEVAQRYFDRSPWGDRIRLHLGPALETIERLEGKFDFVFLDADKDGYVSYYEAVFPRLAPRGLIAVDNTLSSGRVLDGEGPIQRFNEHVRGDPRAVRVILTVRDGVTLIRRR